MFNSCNFQKCLMNVQYSLISLEFCTLQCNISMLELTNYSKILINLTLLILRILQLKNLWTFDSRFWWFCDNGSSSKFLPVLYFLSILIQISLNVNIIMYDIKNLLKLYMNEYITKHNFKLNEVWQGRSLKISKGNFGWAHFVFKIRALQIISKILNTII